ncbi:extracellular solute-binding protein [Vibrio breoganii]|uniref:extracellular solute-binding protein n=1 Tax=Vibrio breoganii TaxID=553239 RepID=UPI0002D4C97B|nr:extracellular solute-binding protein [Vibrio breoganii]
MSIKHLTGALLATALFSAHAQAKTEVEWWHAMGGALGQKVNEIAADFNASQSEYEIKPVFKGSYAETMTGAIAAFRAKEQPAIVQVFEVGTATMMGAQQAIYPVYQLMEDTKEPFDADDYLPSVTGYYTSNDGKMLSMPFNSSTPVMYYNQDMFEKAGIKEAPKTWKEMEAVSRKLIASGEKCGFTTSWQSWVQIENFGARNNIPVATNNNGFDGFDTDYSFNSEPFVKHIEQLGKWSEEGIFKYGGRQSDGMPLFYTGECAMTMGSSAGLRPEHLFVEKNTPKFSVKVELIEALGADLLLYCHTLDSSEQRLVVRVDGHENIKSGDVLGLTFSHQHLHLFDSTSEKRIEFSSHQECVKEVVNA